MLGPTRSGTTTFTVTNLTGRPVRARMIPRGQNGAEDGWMKVPGETEVPMGIAATVTVSVTVLETAPGGACLLALDVVPEDEAETVVGQSVAFTAPRPNQPEVEMERRWLRLLLIILGDLLALIGLAVVILVVALVFAN
jgi:hypothetical protein